jgi:phage FluMu protein Com
MQKANIYTHEFIFQKYLDDKCPVCDTEVKSDSEYSNFESGGKCMAKLFRCNHCNSQYTIGFNRNRQPILSEITLNTIN